MARVSLACSDARGNQHRFCLLPSCSCDCHVLQNPHLIQLGSRLPITPMLPPPSPARTRKKHAADAVYDADGRRLCPVCMMPFVRKPGPGRYPKVHPECAGEA